MSCGYPKSSDAFSESRSQIVSPISPEFWFALRPRRISVEIVDDTGYELNVGLELFHHDVAGGLQAKSFVSFLGRYVVLFDVQPQANDIG